MSKRFELDFREEIQNFQPVSRTPQFQQRVPFQRSGFNSNYDYSGYRSPFMNFMSGSNVQISYRDENGEEIPADAEYVPEDAVARRFLVQQNVNQPVTFYQANQLAANSMPSQNRQFPLNNFRLFNNQIELVNPKLVAGIPLRYDNRQKTLLRNVQQLSNSQISQRPDYDSEKAGENSETYEVKSSEGEDKEEEISDDKPQLEKVDPTLPLSDTDESVNEIVDIPTQDVGEAEDEAAQSKSQFIINEGGVDEKNDDETLDTASTNSFAYSYSHYVPHHQVNYQEPRGNYQQQHTVFQHQPQHLKQQIDQIRQQTAENQRPANYYQHVIHYQPDPADNFIGKLS